MVHTCVVVGCRNRRTPGTTLSFYRFPRDPERKQRWIAAVNREGWLPNDGSRLCSTHFISGKQVKNPRSPDYVPSVFAAVSPSQETKQTSAFECSDKQQAQVEAATALLYLQGQVVDPELELDQDKTESMSSLSSSDSEQPSDSRAQSGSDVDASDGANYEEELRALKEENQALKESVEKMSLTEVSLRNDPAKVRFYTGLPNYFVFETVMSSYPDCAVIMDCFTVALEKTDWPDANFQRYGSNTLRYLIGVAPQGVVTFVSKGSPGHIGDKELAEGSGFLNKLHAGDIVLADRRFDVEEAVVARGACLKITGVSEGGQEAPEENPLADASMERMWVRRHVERVIATVKQRYAILNGPVESPFTAMDHSANMTTFDKIVQVTQSCARY
ncbi:hypothetical protein JZ751_028156 [Albula glossodonta]|uniref:THAP-type domain-containing protein n=1 Tax=Albula glossodonta TaxID=121402 RepID=A0A8T2PJL7_9TELE|nr:hypothetical protein JZ751_028156 [Albula glossodonta]